MHSRLASVTTTPLISLLLSCLFVTPSYSQTTASDPSDSLSVGRYDISRIVVSAQTNAPVFVPVSIPGFDLGLRMSPHTLRSDTFQVFTENEDGLKAVEAPPSHTYRGDILDNRSGIPMGGVRASIRHGQLWALLILDSGVRFGIQPFTDVEPTANTALHVVYNLEHLSGGPWTCGTDALGLISGASRQGQTGGSQPATGLTICEVGIDADYHFYQDNGSSLSNTIFDVENVMNGVESIFESDVGITYELSSIVVRTSNSSNPYTTNSSGSLLDEFRNHWLQNMGAIPRQAAHLFTGRNLSGSVIGVAWLSGICNSYGYGLSQSTFTSNYAYRVGLTAHELGHNWSSGHCSGNDCRIMCSGIGGCAGDVTKFGQSSKNVISSHKGGISQCLKPLPDPVALPFTDDFSDVALDTDLWTFAKNTVISDVAEGEPSPPYSMGIGSIGSGAYEDDDLRSNYILASGATGLEVSFYLEHRRVDSGEDFVVEYWNNSLTWKELARVTSDGTDQDYFRFYSVPVPNDGLHDEFRIRFRAEVDDRNGAFFVDRVTVSTCPAPEPYGVGEIGSSGTRAMIMINGGEASPANPNLQVDLTGGTPQSFCVLFSGDSQGNNVQPWGTILVAAPNFLRTYGFADSAGMATIPLPVSAAMVGTTRHFQYATRDPGGSADKVQATGGMKINFCP